MLPVFVAACVVFAPVSLDHGFAFFLAIVGSPLLWYSASGMLLRALQNRIPGAFEHVEGIIDLQVLRDVHERLWTKEARWSRTELEEIARTMAANRYAVPARTISLDTPLPQS